MKAVLGLNAKCAKCPELVKSRKLYPWGKPVWGFGSKKSPVVFIGEAPGKNGCGSTGIPFYGDRSGDLFQACLAESGILMKSVYTTNIIKCCPKDNRTPTAVEVSNCRKWLDMELAKVAPQIIITLGGMALNFFAPERKLMTSVGTAFAWCDYIVVPYYHPAYALRIGASAQYKKDFKILLEIWGEHAL